MMDSTPQYQLFSMSAEASQPGGWRFILRDANGSELLDAEDVEPDVQGNRLELLSVVRGLEALDQPSRVTVMTPSVYVREGILYGLEDWRANNWQWESFGEMVPVKNADLWQRVDRAMAFHKVDCRAWRCDAPRQADASPEIVNREEVNPTTATPDTLEFPTERLPHLRQLVARSRERIAEGLRELARVACM